MADPATITSYDTLLDAVGAYLARSDIDEHFPTFVQLTENRFNSALKAPGMEQVATIALDATLKGAPVPADYVEWISAEWTGATGGLRPRSLRFFEPNSPEFTFRYRPNGPPQYFTVLAGAVRIKPFVAGSIDLAFYRQIPPLSASAQTNWLIAKAPHLYLYGVLAEAYKFQKDEANAAKWRADADERLKLLVGGSSQGKVGRRPEKTAEMEADVAAKALS
ncbi:phage adaptor protein [Methylorubrum suomiense]|uniref:Uncharacterized protein n=1 Tax=Methylorubrum suomiense TaxID=144191 RepID=A0ABQ4USY7_9HYPH|nr:hypothetical protein [Methylorubrum suomiense]GJE74498.1 hypothetical protein BGCPKDLD_1069 [Methylorubrum suomiense]